MFEVGKFEKVSWKQYLNDFKNMFPYSEKSIREIYDNVILPHRATIGSMGYDFFSPFHITLNPNESITIPTGIRYIPKVEGYGLLIYPRSGLGFKYRLQLDNTIGVIDEDYYNSDNEGHIFIRITNDSRNNKFLSIRIGEGFAQGILTPYGVVEGDNVTNIRNGGFGSTTKEV